MEHPLRPAHSRVGAVAQSGVGANRQGNREVGRQGQSDIGAHIVAAPDGAANVGRFVGSEHTGYVRAIRSSEQYAAALRVRIRCHSMIHKPSMRCICIPNVLIALGFRPNPHNRTNLREQFG